jgi:Domain of unknown function (DUF4123)
MPEPDTEVEKADGPWPQLSMEQCKLVDALKRLPSEPLFAVVDGARFADLPETLKLLGLSARSLFLDHADQEIEAASGWLLPLGGQADLIRLLEVCDADCSALVLWTCPFGETALHRHLRTLNIVRIPQSAIPEDEAVEAPPAEGGETEAKSAFGEVLFRHYDPEVIASLLPLLDEAQFARVFGPATNILMFADGAGGLRHAPRPENLPIAPRGLLQISEDQIEDLELAMAEARHARIGSYLRTYAPDAATGLDDHQLSRFVAASNESGRELGLTTERAQGFWAYMMLNSNGKIARDATVRDYIVNDRDQGTPDDKVYNLMHELAETGG